MKNELSSTQIGKYRQDGFLVIENFLTEKELEIWRAAVTKAIENRHGNKLPDRASVYGKGDNKEKDYYDKVFDQLINLWQDNSEVKKLILDERIGKMAAELAGVEGIRVWHDQALIKKPWANPTSWHLDTPYWSFSDRKALSIWIALDDATLENGCLFFLPGTHLKTSFENPGIGKNMDAVFDFYPEFRSAPSVAATMKAGSCSFHNGLVIHGAHANMTPGYRRAMTCSFMPDGNVFNGEPNVLPEDYLHRLKVGDILDKEDQNPLIYKKN
ncbi:MAG: phytanoyl-CoA dioxygenase family protein [Chitinophagaceae bacterium]